MYEQQMTETLIRLTKSNKPSHEKTNNLYMRKQRRRSAVQ